MSDWRKQDHSCNEEGCENYDRNNMTILAGDILHERDSRGWRWWFVLDNYVPSSTYKHLVMLYVDYDRDDWLIANQHMAADEGLRIWRARA